MSVRTASIILPFYFFCCSAWGMANPAAVYCEDLDYAYWIEPGPNGDAGFCRVGGDMSYLS